MSWKDEYQLLDMELHWVIGFHCKNKRCLAYVGHSVEDLLKRFDDQLYPAELGVSKEDAAYQ